MRAFSALLSGLLVGAVQVVAAEGDLESGGCNDELVMCFSSSQSHASAYCSQTLSLAAGTDIVTVTPTVTVTETIVATVSPSDIDHLPAIRRIKKRGVCTKRDVKIDCLSTATATETSDLVAACSCIGLTASPPMSTADATTVTVNVISYTTSGDASPQSCAASVFVSTLTQTETPSASVHVSLSTVTEVETATVTESSVHTETETQTETRPASVYVSTITEIETQTAVTSLLSTVTEVHITTETTVSSYSYPETIVSVSLSTVISVETVISTSVQVSTEVQVSTTTATTTATETSVQTAAPQSLLVNGNFENNSLDGWSVLSRVGSGDTEAVIVGGVGGRYALDIFTNYFARSAASSVSFGQTISCSAGKKYRLTFNYAVISSYTNGNAWSVVFGGATLASGAGASMSWSTAMYTHTCGSTSASNQLELRCSSSNSRQAHFQFDNFDLYPLEVSN